MTELVKEFDMSDTTRKGGTLALMARRLILPAIVAVAVCTVLAAATYIQHRAAPRGWSFVPPVLNAAELPTIPLDPIMVAAVGDSLTAGASRNFPTELDPETWPALVEGPDLHIAAGFALSGTDTTEMLIAARPSPDVDVLVIFGGTNDNLNGSHEVAQTIANLDAIAAIVAAPRVILVAQPPIVNGTVWDAAYQQLATERGWTFVDPWADMRGDYSVWSPDLIHPYPEGDVVIAQVLEDTILQMLRPKLT